MRQNEMYVMEGSCRINYEYSRGVNWVYNYVEQIFNIDVICTEGQRNTGCRIGLVITSLLILSVTNVFSQKLCTLSLDSNERKIISAFRKEFKLTTSDTIFIYHTYHTWVKSSSCVSHTNYYYIWSDGLNNYFVKQDKCYDYTPLKIDNSFFKYYFTKKDSLLSETLKSPSYYLDDGGIYGLIASYNGKEFSASFPVEYFIQYNGNDSIVLFNNQSHLKMYQNFIENYIKELSNKIEYTQKKEKKSLLEFRERGTSAQYEN